MIRSLAALMLLVAPLSAREYPWSGLISPELMTDAVSPDTVLDEIPCDWRPVLSPIVESLVSDCKNARDAVLTVSSQLSRKTGVYYSPERRKHNMNALEALAEKKVSCTGQSILLVCALRSIGIPARAVGVMTWNHIRGNHTWAEAWFDGEWHMIEFNEQDFNTPWVMENIGMLNINHPHQRIMAATPSGHHVWGMSSTDSPVPAEDVTERYTRIAGNWYQRNGLSKRYQRLLIDVHPRSQNGYSVELLDENFRILESSNLPDLQDDIRYMTRLHLPRLGQYFLRINGNKRPIPISATDQPVRIIRLNHQQISSDS